MKLDKMKLRRVDDEMERAGSEGVEIWSRLE